MAESSLFEQISNLFGLDIKTKKEPPLESFVEKANEDGAIVIAPSGVYGSYVDMEGKSSSDSELVTKYRENAIQPELDFAISEIINEAIVIDDLVPPVSVNVDEIDFSDKLKKTIAEEFQEVISLLNFNNRGYDIFRQWYVDGRLYYHAIINEGKEKDGIKELRNIDPRKIRKIREVSQKRDEKTGVELVSKDNEYFVFNKAGFITGSTSSDIQGIKINPDAIIYTNSGIYDKDNSLVLSHLHKAIKPFNQLKMLEDATIIYHLSRAPERRVFYVDVGNLPTSKAEQYLGAIQSKYKNKTVYDAQTGEVRDDKKHLSMLEDYWIPRRGEGRGTEITTLGGGQNLTDNIENTEYFKKKLYKALNVPYSRLEPETQFAFGRATEISRDEVRFTRFIERLRTKFNDLFDSVLEKQLLLKNIVTREDWMEIKKDIKYIYSKDSYFSEMKDIEIVRERFNLLRDLDEYTTNGAARDKGLSPTPYISNEWVIQNVLRQNNEDTKEMTKKIKKELETMSADSGDSEDDTDAYMDGFTTNNNN